KANFRAKVTPARRAAAAGVDVIIAQGVEAGGHLGGGGSPPAPGPPGLEAGGPPPGPAPPAPDPAPPPVRAGGGRGPRPAPRAPRRAAPGAGPSRPACRRAIARRQTASRAVGTLGLTCRGRGNSPFRTAARIASASGPLNGGFPVSRVYRVA